MTTKLDYVLDTSALAAAILGEPEGRTVIGVLERARKGRTRIGVPFLALMEIEYRLMRSFALREVAGALTYMQQWPVVVVESDEEWRHEAARIKATGGLSLADAWMAALATLSGARLVHKDAEFDRVTGLRSMKL